MRVEEYTTTAENTIGGPGGFDVEPFFYKKSFCIKGLWFKIVSVEYFWKYELVLVSIKFPNKHFSPSRKKFFEREIHRRLDGMAKARTRAFSKPIDWEDDEEDISQDPGGACFNNCDTCRKCGGA